MKAITSVFALAIVAALLPLGVFAQTYYPSSSYYPYNYSQYNYSPYGYNNYYNYGYYNHPYYQTQPTCSINYSYINNAYRDYQGYHQPVQLSWSSNNAWSAYISGIGSVAATGQRVVYPSGSATYAMTVYGPGGNGYCQTSYTQPYYQQQYYQPYYYQYPYNCSYYSNNCYTYPYYQGY